jgi:hypothetical protein
MIDKKLREEMIAAAERGAYKATMIANEQYLTAEELCKQFQMFTKDWIDNYGDILPRKKIHVKCTISGKERGTRWGYAKLEIAENIRNGVYDDMKILR